MIYPREPEDTHTVPEKRNVSCYEGFYSDSTNPQQVSELVREVLGGEAELTVCRLYCAAQSF